ncbi:DNRLRE domain-containing protein [Rhodocytophaga rosea]|uniref:DNRLRE domain-containing protein n=1 Tax=Rhodocytophaga rosea TaxID=2704465 RepID=A0A6C0GI57_9BACT|nr:DNRLRE domain-containing protein [Rhodocytophaga rosea]QHT67741.1 DNRLRE domain-containing protein [Rhodocytophaga rosea]
MFIKLRVFLLHTFSFLLMGSLLFAQTQQVLTLQPDSKVGKDAYIHEYMPDRNFGNDSKLPASAWTYDGTPGILRGLIAFNLTVIPPDAVISEATLSLYHSTDRANPLHSTLSGPNTTFIQRIVSPWQENTVTWDNQPKVTSQHQVVLPVSSRANQDYLSIAVTKLVQEMFRNPKANYGFMIRLQTESYYRALMFSSSDNIDPALHPRLTIHYTLPAIPQVVQVSTPQPKDKISRQAITAKPAKVPMATIVHDTVYIDRVRVDTVFVNRLRVDTVYTRPSVQEVDFSPLTNYAFTNLVLLLDVSGSMNSPQKLPLLKQSVKRLLPLLRPEDKVTIVVYSGKAKVMLQAVAGSETAKINQVIDQLQSDGSTDANAGLTLAYKVAGKSYIRGGNNRIILATDGSFSVHPEVHTLIEQKSREEIFLSVFDFSRNNNQSGTPAPMLQTLAEKGRGNCVLILPDNSDLKLVKEIKAKPIR